MSDPSDPSDPSDLSDRSDRSDPSDHPGPLDGIKVIELAHTMAGPVCGLMLADLGADVIKVEKAPRGDSSRRMVPPEVGGESAAFMMMNRNKRAVAVDLEREEGVQVVRRLLGAADVAIENFRAGTMERFGLGYECLRRDNPGLIYAEISGFGRTGPYRDLGGFDLVAQGMSGLMSLTGEGPERPPVKCGVPLTDVTAGILAALGVLAAWVHRSKTGEGQRVDTSLFEAGIVHTYWQSAITFATGVAPGAMGSAHPLAAPYQAFEAADGWLTVGAANDSTWRRLTGALGASELAEDPRFATNERRMANLSALADTLASRFRRRTVNEWLELLHQAGVPAGPVNDVAAMHRDPQTLARDMVTEVHHSRLGATRSVGLPVKLSLTPGRVLRGAPLYGEHTREVLVEHGYPSEEIEKLAADRVIALRETP